jgi:hypothetical protein
MSMMIGKSPGRMIQLVSFFCIEIRNFEVLLQNHAERLGLYDDNKYQKKKTEYITDILVLLLMGLSNMSVLKMATKLKRNHLLQS